ncbi:MAG: SpoIIE family protein phosphatase [Acetobacter sp.]|nr:SpoIIE family protein phosphatase [Bacteroides sp.]MCM1341143.1 SpoIIE family protein phosphatase [Acetobacter sp.]MCM1433523.1 SpoIIE family protein phosphatase [Clostridiales bacterium]
MALKEKISIKNTGKKNLFLWARYILWMLVSFVLSFSSVIGGCSPFAVSAITVSSKKNFLFSTVGAGLGYILFNQNETAIRYFSAVLICALGTFAINIFGGHNKIYLPMLLSFSAVFATGIVMNLRTNAVIASYALTAGEAILAAGGSFFFFKATRCNIQRLKYKALPVTDLSCLLISCSLLLSGLSFFEIMGVAPARIIAILAILLVSRYGSLQQSLIIALGLGFALGISRENSLFLIGAYAFSTLAAGLFTSLSCFSIGCAFTVSITFFAVAANLGSFSLCCIIESIIASVILCLIPEVITEKISDFLESGADIAPDGSLRQSLVVRLRFASSALAQVSESVRAVREKINILNQSEPLECEFRMVAADQFFSISDMLGDLAFEFDDAEIFDYKSAGKIRRMLGEYDIYPENISVIIDKFNRQRIEILTPAKTNGLSSPKIKNEIEKICGRDFQHGKISCSSGQMLLSMIEKPLYKMDFGFAQYTAEGTLCGDTVKAINDGRGHMIFIISDGMGKGSRAALDGAMGAGLLSKLLSAGFGFDSSLKVVNSALLVKSTEESLATLDCACIDLFTGKCEFYKAGAPRSYIVKNDKLTKCELSSMPAGILRGIEFAKRTTILNVGDEIIMMSDGITDISGLWLEDFISFSEYQTTNEKAKAILNEAVNSSDDRHRDDMSVIVAKMIRE